MGGKNRPDIKSERITYIVEEVAYWRKFNALHGWIVKNCADGVDECQEIHLGVEEIEQLLSTLKKVSGIIKVSKKKKKNVVVGWNAEGDIMEEIDVFDCDKKIVSLLAPTEGFFFGSHGPGTERGIPALHASGGVSRLAGARCPTLRAPRGGGEVAAAAAAAADAGAAAGPARPVSARRLLGLHRLEGPVCRRTVFRAPTQAGGHRSQSGHLYAAGGAGRARPAGWRQLDGHRYTRALCRHHPIHHQPSSPRMRGPSIPESWCEITNSLEYWVAWSSRAMTSRCVTCDVAFQM